MRLIYFVNARIPTERAYGWAISKMCERFADLGLDVLLVLPRGRNKIKQSVFDYYSVKKNFKVLRIFNIDLVRHFGIDINSKLLFSIQSISFLLSSLLIKVEKDDLIYLRNIEGLLLWPWKSKNVFLEHHFLSRKDKFFLFLLKRAKGIVVITQKLKDNLVEYGIAPEKILVAPDGVDLEKFDIKITKTEARKKLNLPLDKKIVMYIGLFDEWKGYLTLLRSSEFFDNSKMKLVMIGGTKEQVQDLKKEYPRVIFLGYLPYTDLPVNQKAADVLVIPNSGMMTISKYYTSPLKLFCYMASRRPIVASDLPSIREILDENNAVLVGPDNPKALAQGIVYALKNSEFSDNLSKQAFKDVQKYTWVNRAKNIINFIK